MVSIMHITNLDSAFETICSIIKEFGPCMNDYLYVYDIPHDVYYINELAMDRFMLPSNIFHDVSNKHKLFVYSDDYPMLMEDLSQLTSGQKNDHNLEYRWIGRDGNPIWINCRGRLLRDKNDAPFLMIGCINEIGKQQRADNVSGLKGEKSFNEHLCQSISSFSDVLLLRIGIDDFKIINERFGTQYGNEVLREVAECIRNSLEPGQFVYRIVSDEFMILDLTGTEITAMESLYHRIRSGIEDILMQQNYRSIYTISAGLLLSKDIKCFNHDNYDEIMKLSEFSLGEAKKRGKNQLYNFRQEDYDSFIRGRYILSCLRKSISENFNGFELFFQPIMEEKDETLYAAETLLRFRTEADENISPMEFIPILEESGLIIPVGKWIINNSLAMCKKVRQVYPDFHVSINLSYIQLLKSSVYEDIMESLALFELPPSSLVVELTESGQLENSITVQNIWTNLKTQGVFVALDDFGTGYSNLVNIGNLRPNIVKIDRGFTVKALKNDYEYELLIHIIHMVHSIGLKLVVEGIETKDELTKITKLNPDYIQGYYYNKPCPIDVFMKEYNIA